MIAKDNMTKNDAEINDVNCVRHHFLKQFSPSSGSKLIGIVAVGIFIIGVIFYVTQLTIKQKPRVQSEYDSYLTQKMIPQRVITPDYIEDISHADQPDDARLSKKNINGKQGQYHLGHDSNGFATSDSAHKKTQSMIIYSGVASEDPKRPSLNLPLGTELDAIIEKTVITEDRGVPVIARLKRGYFENGQQIIPRNSRVFGHAGRAIEDRVHVKFSYVVFADGSENRINAIAVDDNGGGGI